MTAGPADFRIRCHTPAAFRDRAWSWLLRAEAEHNLLLGMVGERLADAGGHDPPIYLATVEKAEEVVGCAFRTPPFRLWLTRLPEGAASRLAESLAGLDDELSGVSGPEPAAREFAEAWSRLRGAQPVVGMRQRLHRLQTVTEPGRPVSGMLRAAGPEALDEICAWLAAFGGEVGIALAEPRALGRRLLEKARVYLWCDPHPVAMAAALGSTPRGIRIGYVYTPPSWRGHGYASWLVARVSQAQLESGKSFCVLYTDLGNKTSNALYQRLGYRPLLDVVDYDFPPIGE